MTSPDRSPRTCAAPLSFLSAARFLMGLVILLLVSRISFAAIATTTTLSISSTAVPYKTPITLTAVITTSGGSSVTTGLVMFCDADAPHCENNSSLLGQVQLTAATATAVVKIGSGPLGTHRYKAVYRANSTYSSSTSNIVSYTVKGTYNTGTSLASSGTIGNYALASVVSGLGAITSPGPSGNVTFRDTSAGNSSLGTQSLGAPVLTNTFTQAANSPFTIGDGLTTSRSLVVASSYLDGDNNIDVITGDADHVITVLLGNGDGTFKPKVNYPGCPQITSGKENAVQKILLADFNRDGVTDIALGCSDRTNGGIGILIGNGDGSFQSVLWRQTGDLAGMGMGDFNSDGLLDIAITHRLDMNVKILLGNGDGTFQSPVTVATTANYARNLVVADFDGDAKDDVAYAYAMPSNVSTLAYLYLARGRGDGTFRTPQLVASSIGEFLTAGDTNADDLTDIISSTVSLPGSSGSSHISDSMYVLLGNGDGTFQSTLTYTSDIPSDPHLADVNGDGYPDIIAGGSYGAIVYHGNGDGTFQPYDEPVIGGFTRTYSVAAVDYNNDGNADLIGTDADHPRAAVALSEVKQAADAVALTGVAVFPLGSGTHDVDALYSGDSIYIGSNSTTVPLIAAPAPTTLGLVVSPTDTAVLGQAVTLTATLAPYTVGPPTTTTNGQLVTFFRGNTVLGTGTLSNGIATLTTSTLTSGNAALKAVYPGDSNYLESTSSVVSYAVSTVVLASSPNPSDYTQPVTLTATAVAGATGTVTFKEGTVTLGTAPLSAGSASITTAVLPAGQHSITALYNGDSSHASATSPAITQVVNKILPAMSLTTSGQTTYLSEVTITSTVPADATGSVSFTAAGTTLGTATITSGLATITTTALPVGNNTITASYGGDTNYKAGTASIARAVTKASPTSVLSSSLNPSTHGAAVTFKDTLPNTVTGTVLFQSNATTIGTVPVVNGIASLTISNLAVGSTTITATYSGDTNNNTSVATLDQTVLKDTPSVAVMSSLNPSLVNQTITLTATLPADATGVISFSNGTSSLGTATLLGGIARLTTSSLPAGGHVVTALYDGDANYNTASNSLVQVVNKADTPISLASSHDPSIVEDSITFTVTLPAAASGIVTLTDGASVLGNVSIASGAATLTTSSLAPGTHTVTATYDGDNAYKPASTNVTQTVSRKSPALALTTSGPSVYGQSVTITASLPTGVTGSVNFTSGTTALGVAPVDASGIATIVTTTLPVGSNTITAIYSGDASNNTATATTTQQVTKATPSMTVTASSPIPYGSAATITASLPATVTGTVIFTEGGTSLGTVVVANGIAMMSTSMLNAGSHTIKATYSGDSNYNQATGDATQVVNKAVPALTLASSINPSSLDQSVTFTATLPADVTGAIQFYDGANSLGSGVISAGAASVSNSSLALGPHTIRAVYSGNNNYGTADATLLQSVKQIITTMTVTTSGPSSFGDSVTITATVPAGATGSVTFTSGATILGTSTISSSTNTATLSTTTLPVGTHSVTADYGGDTNYIAASASTTQTVNKLTPTVTVSTPGPSSYGEVVTITVALPPGTTGDVTVSSGGSAIGTGVINPSTGITTVTTATLPVGTNTITVTYPGDANHNAGSGTTTQVVNKLTPVVSLVSSLNPSHYGDDVLFTASIPAAATGTITFIDGGTPLGSNTLSGGVATLASSTLVAGSHNITAVYSGDANTNAATSALLTQVVNKLVVTLPPPSVSETSPAPGATVTISEQVSSVVTGTVTFYSNSGELGIAPIVNGVATINVSSLPLGSNLITASIEETATHTAAASPATTVTVSKTTPTVTLTSSANPSLPGDSVILTAALPPAVTGVVTFHEGATLLGTATISHSAASLTENAFTVGTHTIIATYGGDTAYNTAMSAPLNQIVGKATPTLPPPSVSNPTQSYGGSQTITETVPSTVSGPVTFYSGATPIGTSPIVNGVATITINDLPVGINAITATTPGDTNNNPATSPSTIVTVTKTTPVLPAPIVSDANPAPNTPVTITEHVSSDVYSLITFSNSGTVIGSAVVTNGVAVLTVASLPIGSNSITAAVAETVTSNAAVSPPTTVTVGLVAPTVTLTSSANPATYGQSVTFTAAVTAGATGSILFEDGTAALGTATVNNAGVAALTVASLNIGTHTITAAYGGNTTYKSAISAPLSQIVNKIPTTITLATSTGISMLNGPVTLTAVVSSTVPTPTGTITFLEGTTPIGTASLSSNGIAVGFQLSADAGLALTSLSTGTHTITAVYSGDQNFLTSTSAPINTIVHDFTNKNTGEASRSIYPGETASYQFTLSPLGTTTFPGNVGLSVAGLPANVSYTFSPSSIAAGATATHVTLTIATSKAVKTSSASQSFHGLSFAAGIFGFVGFSVLRRSRRTVPRLLLILLCLVGAMLPVISLTGCAGGYFAPTPSSYTVTVTGTEGNMQRSATATLLLQQ